MDQSIFRTLQSGREIAKELEMPVAERQVRGNSFTLSLIVDNPFTGEKSPLDIIVDRAVANIMARSHKLANGDIIVETMARLELEGEAFQVSILFQLEQMHDSGAQVFVSKDMERIIQNYLTAGADQQLPPGEG